jgi:glycosyltransferase involved in cell wall biosynthesis
MHVLVVTPLYPPDIAGSAPYVKELARRLQSAHEVTILAYNHIPELVEGVRIVAIEKNVPLLKRLFNFTKVLYTLSRDADVIYVQNGPSVELPLFFVSLVRRRKIVLCLSDETALTHAAASRWYRIPFQLARMVSSQIIIYTDAEAYTETLGLASSQVHTDIPQPHTKPEIHTFESYPHDALRAYETSWTEHTTALITLFSRI